MHYPSKLFESDTAMYYRFKQIIFSGGESIPVEPDGLLILVGPNNSGKSRALRDLQVLWRGQNGTSEGQTHVVTSTEIDCTHGWDTFHTWMREQYGVRQLGQGREQFFTVGAELTLSSSHPPSWLKIDSAVKFLVLRLDTESRLGLSSAPTRIDPLNEQAQHFIHILQKDTELLREIQKEVRGAFGLDIAIDHLAGQRIPLLLGKLPDMQEGWDSVHPEYVKKMRAQMLPLDEAGDGVRSYISTIASVLSEKKPVLLIDEPEAFLHPPQARRLGKLLAQLAMEHNRQLVIATHSSEFVRGALSSTGKVAVCRLQRESLDAVRSVNHGYIQNSTELRTLWEKPLLRSAHTINGIFHRGVVVCEADADARLYEALLVRLEESGQLAESADLHFVHGGGKSELSTLASSYTRLHIPVAVIADFDLLRDTRAVQKLVKAMQGDFDSIKRILGIVSQALVATPPIQSAEQALNIIQQKINEIRERQVKSQDRITGSDRKFIANVLSETQNWSEAKRYGSRCLRGQQLIDCRELISKLAKMGIFVVPSGELESWDEELPVGQKDVWILKALTKIAQDASSLQDACDFVQKIAIYISSNALPVVPNKA